MPWTGKHYQAHMTQNLLTLVVEQQESQLYVQLAESVTGKRAKPFPPVC